MASLIEFERPNGNKTHVNPEKVIHVDDVNTTTHHVVIACDDGTKIAVKGTIDEVKRKLGK
jgi:uncharacterized protein YlzI (FlbEa/FlbD family)